MNTARQVISRRLGAGMGPRLTAPVRFSSSSAGHHAKMSNQDRQLMHGVFTVGSLGVAGGVAFAAARSGGRVGTRYTKKNATLDSSKWFAEGSEAKDVFGVSH